MTSQIITNGTRQVKIRPNGESFFAMFMVNVGQDDGDVVDARSFTTIKGAEKWAKKKLAA